MGDEGVWVRNGSALAGSRGSGLGGKNCWYGHWCNIVSVHYLLVYVYFVTECSRKHLKQQSTSVWSVILSQGVYTPPPRGGLDKSLPEAW